MDIDEKHLPGLFQLLFMKARPMKLQGDNFDVKTNSFADRSIIGTERPKISRHKQRPGA